MMTRCVLAVLVGILAAPASGSAQDLLPGMFVGTPDGPQELAVYAERTPANRLKPPVGTLDDVQTVAGEVRLICNLPHWRLRTIWLSTGRVFRDDAAERRTLRADLRRLTVSAMFARVADSGDPARWRRLLTDVGAAPGNPAYVFVTMESDGMVRDFIVGVEMPSALAP